MAIQIECFDFRRVHGVDRDGSLRPIPKAEYGGETYEQQRSAAGVADTKRAIGKVGPCGTEGGGVNNCGSVKGGVEFLRKNLRNRQHCEQTKKEGGASQVAPIERHGDGITTGFSERCRSDLNDPKDQGDLWDLA